MIKRRLSLTIAIAMMLMLMIPTVAFGAVNDYSGHWAEETIQTWFDEDMIKGYEDGTFRPDTQVSRAEFMTMVNKAFDFTETAEIDFADVDVDDWFYQEVQKAVQAGYSIGYEDNTARPDNKITRQEAALMIARINDLGDFEEGADIFADVTAIAAWAKGAVGAIADEGYIIGYEDNTFRPLRFISRAEALVTIDRAINEVEPGTGDDTTPSTTPAAISYTIDDEELVLETTTASAITSASDITIMITTYQDEEVSVINSSSTDEQATSEITVTTSSAIDGAVVYEVNVELEFTENIITITVGDKEYILTVTKDELSE